MSFFKIILKNSFRNKSRIILTMIGISIGILCIVCLGMVSTGLSTTIQDDLGVYSYDISVKGQSVYNLDGSSEFMVIDQKTVSEILNKSEVNGSAVAFSGTGVDEDINESISFVGVDVKDLETSGFNKNRLSKGSLYHENSNEVLISNNVANYYGYTIGDTIKVSGTDFKIVGIFKSSVLSSTDMYLDSNVARELFNSTNSSSNSSINNMFILVNEDVDASEFNSNLESEYTNSSMVFVSTQDYLNEASSYIDTIDGLILIISLLSIVIGAINTVNTMLMSVTERTKEIGVFRAVGWKNKRILSMILIETFLLTFISTIVGIVVGYLLMTAINSLGILPIRGMTLSLTLIIEIFAMAIIIGLIGGIIPALKAIKIEPVEALR